MIWRKIGKGLFWLVFTGVTGLVIFFGYKVFYQYQQTAVWQNTKLEGTINNVPPELAKNYITADQIDDLEIWSKLEAELQTIRQQKMIPIENVAHLEDIYQQALISKERQHITHGEIATQIESLRLYLDITNFVPYAYEKPEPERLSTLYHQMEYLTLEKNLEVNKAYLEQLTAIVQDYQSLDQFITNTLPLLGEVSKHTVLANRKLTSVDTNSILEEIRTMNLIKFPNIKALNSLLMSGDWINAVTLNEVANQYDQWQLQKQIAQALTQKDYLDVSTITTYKQALAAGIYVEVPKRESYEVSMDSPIKEIKYNGGLIIPGEYILKGTPLTATISPIYEAITIQTSETESTTSGRRNSNTTETTTTSDTSTTTTTTSSSY